MPLPKLISYTQLNASERKRVLPLKYKLFHDVFGTAVKIFPRYLSVVNCAMIMEKCYAMDVCTLIISVEIVLCLSKKKV